MYPELNKLKMFNTTLLLVLLLMLPAMTHAQVGISEIITDYNGFWKSGKNAINPVKPDNSHNLLAFTYNGVRYSTGANDEVLSANNVDFITGHYRALPLSSITGTVNSNTKIGLGALYDGVYNGAPAVKPENKLSKYLSDGLNGLDLGTCIANIPAGDMFLPISNLNPSAVGDGIPDLLITQVADPSTSALDRYEFTDIYGNRIGNSVEIVLSNLPVLGNWTADFYEASTNPMVLTSGYTQTDRAIRLWAADFSAFGITAEQLPQLAYFKIRLNGNSDVAFVAYNASTVDISNPLPAKLGYFNAAPLQNEVNIAWKTLTETNTDHFVVEQSADGLNFFSLSTVKAAGNSTDARQYSFTHRHVAPGKIYYRLKMVDLNGQVSYSEIISVTIKEDPITTLCVYPNPASDKIYIRKNRSAANEKYQVRNMAGVLMIQKEFGPGSGQHSIDISSLTSGIYFLVRISGDQQEMVKFIRQ